MMATLEDRPITKDELDRLDAEIEKDQEELNRIGESYREDFIELGHLGGKLLQKSQELDEKLTAFTAMQLRYRKQQKPLA